MKNIVSIIFLSCVLTNANATIRRVNNNPGISAPYSSTQQAYNAAVNGDTILIEASPTIQSTITSTKQLTWIGTGYFLTSNNGLQANANTSRIDQFIINAGSSGSKFLGIEVNNFFLGASNILISRCKVNNNIYLGYSGSVNNLIINECFVQTISTYSTSSNGIMFSNNYCHSLDLDPNYITGVTILNNYFNSGYIYTGLALIKNNIINNTNGNQIFSNNANVNNNLFMNQTNINYVANNGNIFVPGSPTTTNNVMQGPSSTVSDAWMKLKVGSPAIGSGEGGIDIGPFGGNSPYVLSGIPSIPTIFSFQASTMPGNVLPCVISTKSNN